MKLQHRPSAAAPTIRVPFVWMFLVIILTAHFTVAQSEEDNGPCFRDDQAMPVCISSEFLPFWEHNGGPATFGKPLAAPITRPGPGGQLVVQYFEKARLEQHPDNPQPYRVLLGRIGAERLDVIGHGAETAETLRGDPGCQFFTATDKNVCGKLLEYWQSHGLKLDSDPAISQAESLALLGLPLTGVGREVGPSGETLHTQWFERAKLVETAGVVAAAPIGRDFVSPLPPPAPVDRTPTPSIVMPISPTAPPPPTPDSISTPTISPIRHVSYPAIPCNQNVPVPANGLQAWVIPGGEQMVVCLRLILEGEAVAGANAIVYRHYDTETLPTIAHTTGLYHGVASFIFYTGGSFGKPNQLEGIASYRGVTYRALVSP